MYATNWKAVGWNNEASSDASDGLISIADEFDPQWNQPMHSWNHPASSSLTFEHMYFGDGKMRIDQVVTGNQGELGMFVSAAVGCYRRDRNGFKLLENLPLVFRWMISNSPQQQPVSVGSICYEPIYCDSNNMDTLKIEAVNAMRAQEAYMYMAIEDQNGCIVADGPLSRISTNHPTVRTLAYAKTSAAQYLPPEYQQLLSQLQVGARSPLFYLKAKKVWSWYVRLPLEPSPIYSALSSVVRLETQHTPDMDQAQNIANFSAVLLCGLASHPTKDARAPQNLVSTSGVERCLSRYLGDMAVMQTLIHRHLNQG